MYCSRAVQFYLPAIGLCRKWTAKSRLCLCVRRVLTRQLNEKIHWHASLRADEWECLCWKSSEWERVAKQCSTQTHVHTFSVLNSKGHSDAMDVLREHGSFYISLLFALCSAHTHSEWRASSCRLLFTWSSSSQWFYGWLLLFIILLLLACSYTFTPPTSNGTYESADYLTLELEFA